MMSISPLSRKQIKSVKLLGKRSERHRQGLFIVEGKKAVQQVTANRVLSVESLILDGELTEKSDFLKKVSIVGSGSDEIQVFSVPSRVFRQLTDTESTQGVMAVCRMPAPVNVRTLLSGNGIILTTDHVQDPGNLGTMLRTSVWFGLAGIVASPGTVDLFHPKVVRSTAGATGALPWLESNLPQFLSAATDAGWRVHLLDAGAGALSYTKVRPTGRDIIVVGNEANGLVSVPADENRLRLRIDPVAETGVESLNVSVAAAIITAHFTAFKPT